MKKILVIAAALMAVWFIAASQHSDNGSVGASAPSGSIAMRADTAIASGPNASTGMRMINTPAGALKLMGPPPMQTVRENLTIEKWTWHKGGFETVFIADFTFNNKNNFDIKDVRVNCTDSAESGTVIDSNERVIYQRFPANSRHTVANFSMGFVHSQVRSASCQITDFQIIPGTEKPQSTAKK